MCVHVFVCVCVCVCVWGGGGGKERESRTSSFINYTNLLFCTCRGDLMIMMVLFVAVTATSTTMPYVGVLSSYS